MKTGNTQKLTYLDLDKDFERYCQNTGKLQMGIPVVRGYDAAREFVFNAYLEKQLYRQGVDYLLDQNWEWGIKFPSSGRSQEAKFARGRTHKQTAAPMPDS